MGLIMQRSEALVNEISERSRNDALKRADIEVQTAMKRVSLARESMLEFRNKSNVINPVASASSIATTLTQLMKDKITLENSRGSLSDVMDKTSPTQRILQTQIETLDRQISQLQEKLTSQQSNNVISGQISNFEELQLETQFAEKLLTISQSAYEKARMEQDRQQLYLVSIVKPTVPERATYPYLPTAVPMIFVVCLILWAMVALIIASIKDHLG
jgi:capsule polysaccharide export protein KpsE/RkpR